MIPWLLILTGVLLNATAQLLLKIGMSRVGHFEFALANALPIGLKIITCLPIIGGLTCFAVSLGLWLLVLSRMEVSLAYPMMSLGYVATALGSWWLLGDNLTPLRMLGIMVIVFGVFLVSKSA